MEATVVVVSVDGAAIDVVVVDGAVIDVAAYAAAVAARWAGPMMLPRQPMPGRLGIRLTHGGRALDRLITSAAAPVPKIAQALEDSATEVYVDSGIRSGADVLGFSARRGRFVGRPALWGFWRPAAPTVRTVLTPRPRSFTRR